MSLQRSKYICIDDRTDKDFVLWNHSKKLLMGKLKEAGTDNNKE